VSVLVSLAMLMRPQACAPHLEYTRGAGSHQLMQRWAAHTKTAQTALQLFPVSGRGNMLLGN